jgi:hypothetical protein
MNGEDLKLLATRAETVTGRAERRLDEVHARIRAARRRRRTAMVGGVMAAVVVVAIAVSGVRNHLTSVGPTGPSPSIPSAEVVKPHPF